MNLACNALITAHWLDACPSEAHTRMPVWTDWRQWYACMAHCLVREEVINTRHTIMLCSVLIHISYASDNWEKIPQKSCLVRGFSENSRPILFAETYKHNIKKINAELVTYHEFLWCWGHSGGVCAWGSAVLDSRKSSYELSVYKINK